MPSVSPLLKKRIRLGHTGIVDHSVDLSIPDLKKSTEKEWTEAIKTKKIYKETCIKRYPVERTNKTEIRPEEQSEKTDNLWNKIQLKGP